MGQTGLLAVGKQAWNDHEFEVRLAYPARACLRTTQTTKAARLGSAALSSGGRPGLVDCPQHTASPRPD